MVTETASAGVFPRPPTSVNDRSIPVVTETQGAHESAREKKAVNDRSIPVVTKTVSGGVSCRSSSSKDGSVPEVTETLWERIHGNLLLVPMRD